MDQERPPTAEQAESTDDVTPASEPDTEGHSMLAYELGVNVTRERQRQAERATQDARRAGDRPRRGLFDRIRGR